MDTGDWQECPLFRGSTVTSQSASGYPTRGVSVLCYVQIILVWGFVDLLPGDIPWCEVHCD